MGSWLGFVLRRLMAGDQDRDRVAPKVSSCHGPYLFGSSGLSVHSRSDCKDSENSLLLCESGSFIKIRSPRVIGVHFHSLARRGQSIPQASTFKSVRSSPRRRKYAQTGRTIFLSWNSTSFAPQGRRNLVRRGEWSEVRAEPWDIRSQSGQTREAGDGKSGLWARSIVRRPSGAFPRPTILPRVPLRLHLGLSSAAPSGRWWSGLKFVSKQTWETRSKKSP